VDIGHFGPQRERIEHHGVEELRCQDYGLGLVIAKLDYVLLNPANFLDRKYSAELASRDQNRIANVQNLVDIVDCVLVF